MPNNDAIPMNVVEVLASAELNVNDNSESVAMSVAEGGAGSSGKADKVSGATAGDLAGLDATGNLTDSGKKPADFVAAENFYATQLPMSSTDPTTVAQTATELKSQIDQKAPIITDTVSNVAIASVPDAASNLPLSALKIAVEPVQDLHGQDAPYPPGGGVNKLLPRTANYTNTAYGVTVNYDKDTETAKFTGSNTDNAAHVFMSSTEGNFGFTANLTAGDTFYFGGIIPLNMYAQVVYKKTGGSIAALKWIGGTGTFSVTSGTVPEDYDGLARVDIGASPLSQTSGDVKLIFTVGSTAPTAWTPYSNICPITGWTGANVYRTGKNLLDQSQDARLTNCTYSNGKFTATSHSNLNGSFVRLRKGTTTVNTYSKVATAGQRVSYTITADDTWDNFLVGYLMSGQNICASFAKPTKNGTYTVSFTTDILPSSSVYGVFSDVQIDIGSIATGYEAYQGSTYPISWQTEAGTVYGGQLDPVNGVLTVKGVYRPLSDKTLWYADGNYISYRYDFSDRKLFSDSFTGVLCSALPADESKPSYIRWRGASQLRISTVGVTIEDLQDLSESNQIGIYYPLATPVSIPLSAVEIATLTGTNNLWADTGNVIEMTYPCDTKLYIDKKLAELTALVLES